jgi:hypothetical protein
LLGEFEFFMAFSRISGGFMQKVGWQMVCSLQLDVRVPAIV